MRVAGVGAASLQLLPAIAATLQAGVTVSAL
jgi:hypothetical protein